jgi:hypothetical protein
MTITKIKETNADMKGAITTTELTRNDCRSGGSYNHHTTNRKRLQTSREL